MAQRPNILLVTVDQWPGNLLGVAGHPIIETPTLDTLAHAGIRYRALYSECPVCIPARRTLMTGTSPRKHGDRVFKPSEHMPDLPTLAGTLREAGYQATSVGKLHVFPQRDRIGFDDTILYEEGRPQLGSVDDYDMFLSERGYTGQQFLHGMSNNDYNWRTWHLPEECHVTNWTASEMCRAIKRRDPTRPAFWNLSFSHPHPPLVPLEAYMERYARREMDAPLVGDWAEDADALPEALKRVGRFWPAQPPERLADIRRAFYALCTHIDHQLRLVIGTLREEGVLDDTAILFTSDHGDMLGDHGLYAKRLFMEQSANVPGILVLPKGDDRCAIGTENDGLFALADIMPTLLDIAGIDVPSSCDGRSMLSGDGRSYLYGECMEDDKATRMILRGTDKLIWYPAGNRLQLFDLANDPDECCDLSEDPSRAALIEDLQKLLIGELYGTDDAWHDAGRLIGFTPSKGQASDNRGLSGQRGVHYPAPPASDPAQVVGNA